MSRVVVDEGGREIGGVFGISRQPMEEMIEAKARLRVPYTLLCDQDATWGKALGLPELGAEGEGEGVGGEGGEGGEREGKGKGGEGRGLWKRVTLAVRDGVIVKVWYPVFPPERNVDEVIGWVREWKGTVPVTSDA